MLEVNCFSPPKSAAFMFVLFLVLFPSYFCSLPPSHSDFSLSTPSSPSVFLFTAEARVQMGVSITCKISQLAEIIHPSYCLYSSPPLTVGNTFQDPQWRPLPWMRACGWIQSLKLLLLFRLFISSFTCVHYQARSFHMSSLSANLLLT